MPRGRHRLRRLQEAIGAQYQCPLCAVAKNPAYVWDVLADGAGRARVIAAQTIAQVKDAIGLP